MSIKDRVINFILSSLSNTKIEYPIFVRFLPTLILGIFITAPILYFGRHLPEVVVNIFKNGFSILILGLFIATIFFVNQTGIVEKRERNDAYCL